MNDLLKNPALIVGAVVILAVMALAGKSGGPTYAVTATDPAAFKARSDAQAVTDASLTDARQGIMTAALQYDKQRNDYRTSMVQLRDNYNLSLAGMQTAERLGMAGMASQERISNNQTASQERIAQGEQQTQQQNGILGFFGSLFSGILGLFL